MGNITINSVIQKIEEAKSNRLLPKNWAALIAERTGLTDTTIRNYAQGKKNVPQGPLLVLKHMNEIISEFEEQFKKETA